MGQGKTNTGTALAVDKFLADPTILILSNYHLFGVRYIFCQSVVDIIKYVSRHEVLNGKHRGVSYVDENGECRISHHIIVVVDETYLEGEARRSMSPLTILFTWFLQMLRKLKIELYVIVQNGRFLDWRFSWAMNVRIMCKYNERTHMISLNIKDKDKGTEKDVKYYAPQYWKYYDTDELPHIPEKMLEKATKWSK